MLQHMAFGDRGLWQGGAKTEAPMLKKTPKKRKATTSTEELAKKIIRMDDDQDEVGEYGQDFSGSVI